MSDEDVSGITPELQEALTIIQKQLKILYRNDLSRPAEKIKRILQVAIPWFAERTRVMMVPRPGLRQRDSLGNREWFCMECELRQPPLFMVKAETWKEAGFPERYAGIICIYCFKKRLGRELRMDDFTPIPMNDWWKRELFENRI